MKTHDNEGLNPQPLWIGTTCETSSNPNTLGVPQGIEKVRKWKTQPRNDLKSKNPGYINAATCPTVSFGVTRGFQCFWRHQAALLFAAGLMAQAILSELQVNDLERHKVGPRVWRYPVETVHAYFVMDWLESVPVHLRSQFRHSPK